MAYSLIDTSDLTTLGNAIRTKTGGNATMTVAQMATAVATISSGGGGGGGWTPSTATDITSSADLGKYDGSIDLSSYNSAPYIIIVVGAVKNLYENNVPALGAIGYYNGNGTYTLLVGDTEMDQEYHSVVFSNNTLSFDTFTNDVAQNQTAFYIIT